MEEGAQLASPLSLNADKFPSLTSILQHSDSVTQGRLSCLSTQPGTKADVLKHNCCSALTEDPPNHLRSCYTANTVSSTLSYAPSSSCTNSGLPCKRTKKYVCVPMSIPAPISADYILKGRATQKG